MLSIGTLHAIGYYLNLTGESLEPGASPTIYEPRGYWEGVGAELLGLVADVDASDLTALVEFATEASTALDEWAEGTDRPTSKPNRNPGLDLVFSADKSVSVLWAMADAPLREKIKQAQASAVRAALSYLESSVGYSRRGHGGIRREPGSLVFACFEHGSNRLGEPNLHTHALCFNLVVRPDRRTGALALREVFRQKMAAGALYRLELAHQLQEHIGLSIETYREFFRVAGVPQSVCNAFSKRRQEIKGVISQRKLVSAAGAAAATLATRKKKRLAQRDYLYRRWQQQGQQLGFGYSEAQSLVEKATRALENPHRRPPDLAPLLEASISQLMQQQSSFARRDLIRPLARLALGVGEGTRIPAVKLLLSAMEQHLGTNPEIVRVGEGQFTTREMLALEREMLKVAERLHGRKHHIVETRLIVSAIELLKATIRLVRGRRLTLTPEQQQALEHLVGGSGDLALLHGVAGSGKTYLLKAAQSIWASAGLKVIGLAPEGSAAQALQEATGIPSATIAKLFVDLEHPLAKTLKYCLRQLGRLALGKPLFWPPGRLRLDTSTVVVVDQASGLDTRVLAALFEQIEQSGAKLVLVGDENLPPGIGPNGGFRSLLERFGGAQLRQLQRQTNPLAQRVVSLILGGQVKSALAALADAGQLTIEASRTAAMERLITDWGRRGASRPEESLILAGTTSEADVLNRMAQQHRRAQGKIGRLPLAIGKKPWFSPVVVGGKIFYIGDRVLLKRNAPLYGVANGMMGTLLALDPIHQSVRIRLDGPQKRCITLPLKHYTELELGYAIATTSAPGRSARDVFVLGAEFGHSLEQTYLQLTRAHDKTHLYLDEETGGPEAREVRQQMEIPRPVSLALDSLERYEAAPSYRESPTSPREPRQHVVRVASIRPKSGRTRRVEQVRRPANTPAAQQERVAPTPLTIPI